MKGQTHTGTHCWNCKKKFSPVDRISRECCYKCYQRHCRNIRAKKTTDAELVSQGLMKGREQ